MLISLKCPECGSELNKDIFKFSIERDYLVCEKCLTEFNNLNGCIDFVIKTSADKNFYEKVYKENSTCENRNIDFSELRKMWFNPIFPARKIFLNELIKTNIKNKSILLLGNGKSLKELYFLVFGAKLIYTDISINVVSNVKNAFDFGKYKNKIVFHAADAYNIPINDESVDIVIGYGFVHHLQDSDSFIKEVHRVIKPNGFCLFKDNAHSRVWQKLKFSILKPLVKYSHAKWGISPEDKKATRRGGYRKDEVEKWRIKHNFSEMIYLRFGVLSYVFRRGAGKIFGYNKLTDTVKMITIPFLFFLDSFLSKISNSFYTLTIELVWGFKKKGD